MTDRHYTEPVDEISGTVESVSPGGITLRPGVFVLPNTQNLARTRKKPAAFAHLLTVSRDSSFINQAPACSP